jgi:chromosome partitioning protein
MKVISFVTQKGGAGKSTLAACLAVAAEAAGERVFLLDLDPQGSLTSWRKTRTAESPPVDAVSPAKLSAALTALAKNGYTLAMIDTAGADAPATTAAMTNADLCIIPSRPTAFDVRATKVTRDNLETMGRDYVFVLNQCPPSARGTRAMDGKRTLEMMGMVVSPAVANRVDFQEAILQGLGVTELHPNSKSAQEIAELWTAIKKNHLGERKHGKRQPI